MALITNDDQTIIALATARGSGAIALLRMSGAHCITIGAQMAHLASKKSIDQVPSHTVHLGTIIDTIGAPIDQVMIIVMQGPHTFTGQDIIEITCHNNPFLIEAIIQRAIECGARLAQEGEFTKRAFLNKKLDLVQAESINELIHASTQLALKQSLAQVTGSFSAWLQKIEKDLITCSALADASFEFIDEEMEFGTQIKTTITTVLSQINQLKTTFNYQNHIRQGIRIALIGSVNAGKSSLFNTLLQKERSIVTNIAGTTRDVIEAGVYKKSCYWTLIDTAGLRQTADSIEQEGINRSYQEAHIADCVLLIIDGSRSLFPAEKAIYEDLLQKYSHKIIVIKTKADLEQNSTDFASCNNAITVSIFDRNSVKTLEEIIEQKIDHDFFNKIESPFLLNQRQFNLVKALEKDLITTLQLFQDPVPYELVSYHLKEALTSLTQLTGKTVSEQAMDAIFREFCIGK